MIQMEQWNGFEGRLWKEEVNVRDFIQNNYKPYDGDASFLAGPTESTRLLWEELKKLQKEERAKTASWIWIPMWFLPLLPMVQAISMSL